MSTLLTLVGMFASLSLVSFGGGNVVLPEIHRQAVTIGRWLTGAEFASVFAIAQVSPGPSTVLLAGLVGLRAAGWTGALVSAAAMLVPSATLMFGASVAWDRFREAPWRVAVEKGLAPISVGLLLASALIIVRAADHSWPALLLTAVTTVLFLATRLNPLIILAGAALLGWLGLVR